jgi:hypothetical protein
MANHIAHYEPTPEEIEREQILIRRDWWKSDVAIKAYRNREGSDESSGPGF